MGRGARLTRWRMLAVSVALVGGTTLAALPVSAVPSSGLSAHSSHGHGQTPKIQLLINHHGPVLSTSDTYAIWWGAPTGTWATYPGQMASFLGGLEGTTFLQTAAQYMPGGVSVTTSYKGSFVDPSAPPTKVSVSIIAAEVTRVLANAKVSPDPDGVYLVFTSNFPKGGGYCAWHSGATVGSPSTSVAVAYIPNTAGVPGCADPAAAGLVQDPTFASIVNDTSHEFMESITDPQISAWYDQSGREIGDKCETTYDGSVTIGVGQYYLQEEWSNAAGGCVMTTDPPTSSS